ncbi:MAG: alpha/beta hydrolase, partial [Burkholderiales bacterium]
MGGLNRGGQISEIDEACRPLKEIAARKNDPAAQDAWFQSFMKLAERVERLGDVDIQANHPLSAGRKYLRAGLYYLLAERM